MQHLPRLSITVLITVLLGLVSIPGCLAVGHFSPNAFKQGKDIIVEDQNFVEDMDLTGILDFSPASPGVMKARIEGQVIFKNCNFYKFIAGKRENGLTYIVEFLGDVVFDNCLFRDTVNLDYVVFEGDFYAGNTEFMGPATFDNAWFKGRNVIFAETVFFQKSRFINAVFENKTRFFKTEFKESAMFQASVFKGASFWGATTFQKYAEFGKTRFLLNMDMGEVLFAGKINFNGMVTMMEAYFNGATFIQDVDFSKVRFFQPPQMDGSKFESNVSGVEIKESEDNIK
jgi:hypothetical protein